MELRRIVLRKKLRTDDMGAGSSEADMVDGTNRTLEDKDDQANFALEEPVCDFNELTLSKHAHPKR